jgi:hypothetical protein
VSPDFVHRELLLPSPTKDPPEIGPLTWTTGDEFCLEVHREKEGRVRYALGSEDSLALEGMLAYLESSRSRLAGGAPVDCLADSLIPEGLYARAVPVLKHHHLPLGLQPRHDRADLLLRALSSPAVRDHDVTLQLLFRSMGGWESTFFSPLFDSVAASESHVLRGVMRARRDQSAYHVEVRAHIVGPEPDEAILALSTWLSGWTTPGGTAWRRWKVIPPKKEPAFHQSMMDHCMHCFRSKAGRRDVSATEMSHLLSIPWSTQHPECDYSGAPRGKPGPELVIRAPASSRSPIEPRLALGLCGSHQVALPRTWNHAVLLGRTQSGKSTLALNLALQILRKQPESSVVVIEPTGTLVEGIVGRLSAAIASETVEIDPAHSTFEQNGASMVSVPLGLLQAPKETATLERWAETLSGNLLGAIRSAWGEESIGGRAELVLRALVQGLARTPGTNLVDAYQILTDKKALARFVKTAPPGPLRDFLEHHLPRLDYNFTMSTLDKVGKIATNPLLRVALCQRSHAVSFDQLLKHRLLLLNLSKAALGADGANFLGAIYLTQLWAAIQRSGRPDKPIYLFLDEVHNYAIPTLADMLSEGAKYGLHVVAVTQYLHRVPPRIQAALLGNVDVWLLFQLGVEDMDDAWKIVHGESHGWTPQDLVDGLKPHEVAMATSGSLLKLDTRPCAPPGPNSDDLKAAVVASSRRYAQPEDSEASPWLVSQDDVEALLKALSYRSRSLEELGGLTGLRVDKLTAALRLSEEAGDVERDTEEPGRIRLTPRGGVHLTALEGRRNEGVDHVETLVDLVMWLGTKQIAATIPEQVAGVLMPDGQFRLGGATYNVEVECSTVAKAAEQVIRNVRKAREAGNRVLIALPYASGVPRLLQVLDNAFPGLRLWSDGVGVVWRGEDGQFHPHRVPGTEVWPFLDGDSAPDFDSLEDDDEQVPEDPADQVVDTDPLVHQMRSVVRDLLAADRTEATIDELRDRLPVEARPRASDKHMGKVLALLGLLSRRVKEKGVRFRVYSLAGPTFRARPDGAREGDPSEGPNAIRGPAGPENGSGRRAPNFTSGGPRGDPSTRRDPND